MKSLLSIIICTHNPRRDYLERVLTALQAQILPFSKWELLLVDNASKIPLASAWDLSWHPNARHVFEEELGLTPARLRGIRESNGNLLIFVDDDNILNPNYLECALRLSEKWPMLGVFGGDLSPEFEVSPPEWTRPFWRFLAIREVKRDLWSNNICDSTICPWGAGMVIRRNVADAYSASTSNNILAHLLDRRGENLFSGGDNDIVRICTDIGLGFGLFGELHVTHLIPARRLEENYLLALVKGMTTTNVLIEFLRTGRKPSKSGGIRGALRHIYNLLVLPSRSKRFYLADRSGRMDAFHMLDQGNFSINQINHIPKIEDIKE